MAPRSKTRADKTAGASGRSGGGRLAERLLAPQTYKGVDKLLIVIFVFVFCALFLWLVQSGRNVFAYWSFLALLTLIFVGILRAVGMVRSQGIIIGGSVAIFVALFLATRPQFEKYQDARIDDLNARIGALEKAMMYDETRVEGWVEFAQWPDSGINVNAFRIGLRPSRDSVDGPFEGNQYYVWVDVPIKKNQSKQTEKIFQRLTVEYPGYFTGCVLLASEEADPNCATFKPGEKFHLKLIPSPGDPSS